MSKCFSYHVQVSEFCPLDSHDKRRKLIPVVVLWPTHVFHDLFKKTYTHIHDTHTWKQYKKIEKNELIKVKDKTGWYIFYSDFDKKEINITIFIDTRFHSSYIMTTSWDLTPGSPHN